MLSTGRCGSTTFAEACAHLDNYTSGHETRWNASPAERLDYPDGHIEVDNRLSWQLGRLDARYPDARYVHLLRDPEAVAQSYAARWWYDPHPPGASIPRKIRTRLQKMPGVFVMHAWAYSLWGREHPWDEAERLDVVRAYVDTVTSNIELFLRSRPHRTVHLETAAQDFPEFCDWISAEGDVDAAVAEFSVRHNVKGTGLSTRR